MEPYKKNVSDIRNSYAINIYKLFKNKFKNLHVCDPLLKNKKIDNISNKKYIQCWNTMINTLKNNKKIECQKNAIRLLHQTNIQRSYRRDYI